MWLFRGLASNKGRGLRFRGWGFLSVHGKFTWLWKIQAFMTIKQDGLTSISCDYLSLPVAKNCSFFTVSVLCFKKYQHILWHNCVYIPDVSMEQTIVVLDSDVQRVTTLKEDHTKSES